MSLIDQNDAIAQCAKVFSSQHCERVIQSFILDPGAWWGGISVVIAVVGTVIAYLALRKQSVPHKLPPDVEKLIEDAKSKQVPVETVDVRYPTDDELQFLRTWFQRLELPEEGAAPRWTPRTPIRIELVAEVDAERHFIAKGSERGVLPGEGVRVVREGLFGSEYAISPEFMSWADNGEEILVACDQHGIRRYRLSERGLDLRADHYSTRPPIAWRQLPKWCRWSVHPFLGLSPCYFIDIARIGAAGSDLLFVQLRNAEPVPIDLSSSRLRVGGLDAIGNLDALGNPWRPGRMEMMMMDNEGRSSPDGGARAIGVCELVGALGGTGIRDNLTRRLELDDVLPPGHYVRAYCWHHSGQFLAVAVGAQYPIESLVRVLVVEYMKGRVLAASSWKRCLVGWLGTSGRMLLAQAADDPADGWTFLVWTPASGEEQPIDLTNADTLARRLMLTFEEERSRHSRARRANADGSLWLDAYDGNFMVYPTVGGEGHGRTEHKGTAAWSPTDPSLFASVGSIDGKAALRLWKVLGDI